MLLATRLNMNKKTGVDLDVSLHSKLLNDFTNFLSSYSNLLDTAEKYQQNLQARLLFEAVDQDSISVVNELTQVLVNLVPEFIKINCLESDLEQYIK